MEPNGLTKKDAELLIEKYGKNEIKDVSFSSPIKILLRQVKNNFVVYLLFFAFLVSIFIGKNVTAYTILAVIIIVIFTGFIQEYRADKAVKALRKMIIPVSIVIRDGKEQEIISENVVPGDIIILRSGERVPADCLLLEEKDLFVDESILTGESSELRKKATKNFENYSEENMLFMGTFIVRGKSTARVLHTGMRTKFGQISSLISTAEKELPLQIRINNVAKYMATIAIIFAFLTGLLMIFFSAPSKSLLIDALLLSIAIAVSAFPEGFPVVLTTALASGAYKMAKKNAIVNRMSVIETLGETTVICSDKTGTITKGEMTAKKAFIDNNLFDISGTGYKAEGDLLLSGKKTNYKDNPVIDLFLKCAVLCNDSRIERTGEDRIYRIIGGPTEASLLIMSAKMGIFKEDMSFTIAQEIPFSSERKLMSVLANFNDKEYIFSKGAVEVLLLKCKFVQRKNGIFRLTDKERKRILLANKNMAVSSLRTLALAYKNPSFIEKNNLEKDLIFLGLVGMEDPPREEVRGAIKLCESAGIKVKMITGDNLETALAIAKQIGLEGNFIQGFQLDEMNESELSKIVDKISIFARVKPEHKIKIVRAMKMNGEIVTMTGDGVNDAPALKEAHIGVAMGKNGTDVSRSVADLTLKDDNFSTIVEAIREGRTIFKNIRKFVTYQLSCNYAELSILFLGVLLSPFLGWKIPLLLALQILFMNLVTDDLPAITLALTPASKNIMKERPRKKEKILNKNFISLLVILGLVMAFLVLLSFYLMFNILHYSHEVARTVALVSLILLEITSAFHFMSFKRSINFKSFAANKYLLVASVASLFFTFLVVYTPLNRVFETTPIGILGWTIAVSVSLFLLVFFNAMKFINNKKKYLHFE